MVCFNNSLVCRWCWSMKKDTTLIGGLMSPAVLTAEQYVVTLAFGFPS